MSDQSIDKGERWIKALEESLSEHTIGILCITPENQHSPWILFEAGALSRFLDSSTVIPLLIGMEEEDLDSPLNQFQSTVLAKDDMYLLVKKLNELLGELKLPDDILREEFLEKWIRFEECIEKKFDNVKLSSATITLPKVLNALVSTGLPDPILGQTAHFIEGFESHSLYTAITAVAKKRLYIYGRKNRKLFDKEHYEFFKQMKETIDSGYEYDFRVLTLDLEAPKNVIDAAHEDSDFMSQLRFSQEQAIETLTKFGLDPRKYIRTYKHTRIYPVIIVDDAVLYTQVERTTDGQTRALTKGPFTISEIDTVFGERRYQRFIDIWENSHPISINK